MGLKFNCKQILKTNQYNCKAALFRGPVILTWQSQKETVSITTNALLSAADRFDRTRRGVHVDFCYFCEKLEEELLNLHAFHEANCPISTVKRNEVFCVTVLFVYLKYE